MDALEQANALVVRAGLARGRELFNRGLFWASHEAFETSWRLSEPPRRTALQAVIHSAACLHKWLVQENKTGAVRLSNWSVDGLTQVEGLDFELELGALRNSMEQWSAWLTGSGETAKPPLPTLEWTRAADLFTLDSCRAYTDTKAGTILVAVQSGSVIGWSECRATAGERPPTLDDLARICTALDGRQIASPAELPLLWGGPSRSSAAVEAAAWDLFAQRESVPVHVALGIAQRPVQVATVAHRYREAARPTPDWHAIGSDAAIIEVGPLDDRDWIEPVRAAPVPVILDCGGRYTRAYAETLIALGASGAAVVASPFDDEDAIQAARLRRQMDAPLSVRATTVELAESLLVGRSADVVEVDPGVSGIAGALRIMEYVGERGAAVWIRSTARTSTGLATDLCLASHPAATLPIAIDAMTLAEWPHRTSGGLLAAPYPGIGIAPVLDTRKGDSTGRSADEDGAARMQVTELMQ